MSSGGEVLGLRERKRIATRRAIELAVLQLTAEHGFDRVTINDIARVAGISPRTFFNYCATKDEALVGDMPTLPDEGVIEKFVAAGPHTSLIGGLGELFAASADQIRDDREIYLLRKAVMKDHPYLVGLKIATLRRFEEGVRQIVERRLRHDFPKLASDVQRIVERASLITLVASSGLRHAWQRWVEADDPITLSDQVRASFRELVEVVN